MHPSLFTFFLSLTSPLGPELNEAVGVLIRLQATW